MLIREKDKQRLISILSSVDYKFDVWAYGSRVNGRAHEGSDLDIVIRTQDLSPMPNRFLSQIIEQIHDSNIPILVQVQDWARIPTYFYEEILNNYEVLFTSKSIAAEPSSDYGKHNDV